MGRWTIDAPRRLDVDGVVDRLVVRLVDGRLNVVGTDGPAQLEVTSLGSKPLEVSLHDGTLTVEFDEFPSGWVRWLGPFWWFMRGRRRYRADVSIAVPESVRAYLRLISGSLVVSELRGDTEVQVTSGRVTLLGLSGRTVAKVVSGPVEALGVGGELDVETVSGELVVADSTAARVQARTVSGAVIADLDSPVPDRDIRLETVSGEITVRVQEDSDLEVRLFAVSGQLTSAFAEVSTEGGAGYRRAAGVLGGGWGRLRATATSGNISLLRRPAAPAQEAAPAEPAQDAPPVAPAQDAPPAVPAQDAQPVVPAQDAQPAGASGTQAGEKSGSPAAEAAGTGEGASDPEERRSR